MGESRTPQRFPAFAAALALFAAACGEHQSPPERARAAPPAATSGVYYALALAPVHDSAAAARRRDSLAAAGWPASLAGERRAWRVRLTVTSDRAAAELIARAVGQRPDAPGLEVYRDSGAGPAVHLRRVQPVSPATSGMTSRLRWTLSPGGRMLLIVDDAAAIENDPAPAGFVLADERSDSLWQRDSIWDAAPSPDWHTVAYSHAYIARGGGGDTLPDRAWQALAQAAGLPVGQTRRAAFRASGMSTMFGLARPALLAIPSGRDTLLPLTGGWRLAWTPAGDSLAIGHAPEHPRDNSPAGSWSIYPRGGGTAASRPDTAGLASVPWTEGPVLDVSVPPDTARRVYLPQAAGRLTSAGGWIRMDDTIVAPGLALVATASGCFVAALAPAPEGKDRQSPLMAVVYALRCSPARPGPELP